MNGITFYRLIAAPVLLLLIINHQSGSFKWLLAVSFFTDAIDGFLARRYEATSVFGSKLDSIADDLTIVAAITGMIVLKPEFIKSQMIFFLGLLALYLLQNLLALIRYRKFTSFHTYSAKIAAVFQGLFLITIFFLDKPLISLFYSAVILTAIDLIEEIILVLMLPAWKSDVRGLYWVIKNQKESER